MATSDNERYTARFYESVYQKGDYCINKYCSKGEISVVAGRNLPKLTFPVTFIGSWKTTKSGKRFNATMFEFDLPNDMKEITTYIVSKRLGIGPPVAERMVRYVGIEHFWDELQIDPTQFCAINGVKLSAVAQLQQEICDLITPQKLFKFFGGDLRYSGHLYERICKYFDNNPVLMLQEVQANPFVLMQCGYSFEDLDKFCAKRTILPVNDYKRLLAAAQQVLLTAKGSSHVALPHAELSTSIRSLLEKNGAVTEQDIQVFLYSACEVGSLVLSGSLIYLPRSYKEESTISRIMLEMIQRKDDPVDDERFAEAMEKYAEGKGFSLSPDQQQAVKTALLKKVCVITGGPGTGKSTILDAILYCWKEFHDESWLLMAPTGKAGVRMQETTGQYATTIHATLGLNVGNEETDTIDTKHTNIDASLIVVDESSMLDQTVMTSLLLALSNGNDKVQHLILVGDPDQLPSVGWGNVLADSIESGIVPVCRLNTVYRQGKSSPIVTNATKMQNDDVDLVWDEEFIHYDRGSDEQNAQLVVKFYCGLAAKYSPEEVIVLSPYHHATDISTDVLNRRIQEAANPNRGQGQVKFFDKVFRVGDRVMQLRNTESLSNGDIGTIASVNPTAKDAEPCVVVRFETGVEAEYLRDDLDQLELAYAISVHKSQGSQYRIVIFVLPQAHSSFLRRNILYTGITRSTKYVAIVAPRSTIDYCIHNNKPGDRYTNMVARLRGEVSTPELPPLPAAQSVPATAVVEDAVEYIFDDAEDDFDGLVDVPSFTEAEIEGIASAFAEDDDYDFD